MIGGRMGRCRYEGVCWNGENILTLGGGFDWKVLNWMKHHQNAHLKLVILWQITCTQAFEKQKQKTSTASYTSLPFICDQTKPLFSLWSPPETHPNIASLYPPPSVCLACSFTQSFNYSTTPWQLPSIQPYARCWKCRRCPLVLFSSSVSYVFIWRCTHPLSCFQLPDTGQKFCKLLQCSADYTLECQSFIP